MSRSAWSGLLLIAALCALPALGGNAAPVDGMGAWRAVPGIEPSVMKLGSGRAGMLCVSVVELIDVDAACRVADCVEVFPSRRVKTLIKDQRALRAGSCDAVAAKPSLLWGSPSVLVLQADRRGAGLWSAQVKRGEATIRLETEGSVGTLSRTAEGFRWRERPD
jgi:hypothetical protein